MRSVGVTDFLGRPAWGWPCSRGHTRGRGWVSEIERSMAWGHGTRNWAAWWQGTESVKSSDREGCPGAAPWPPSSAQDLGGQPGNGSDSEEGRCPHGEAACSWPPQAPRWQVPCSMVPSSGSRAMEVSGHPACSAPRAWHSPWESSFRVIHSGGVGVGADRKTRLYDSTQGQRRPEQGTGLTPVPRQEAGPPGHQKLCAPAPGGTASTNCDVN